MQTNMIKTIIGAFLVGFCIKAGIFEWMIAEGNSMIPTIYPGSILPVVKIAYGLRIPGTQHYVLRWNQPKSGDVVVFVAPDGSLAVKRCFRSDNNTAVFSAYGDNSPNSLDSRAYGDLSLDCIIGKVLGF
ncbi:MAG: S26 family signal peptidase [Treponema sp.]|jgi:signal peptidase I|nr:S26 family signal peptidase [Treponema sp.]